MKTKTVFTFFLEIHHSNDFIFLHGDEDLCMSKGWTVVQANMILAMHREVDYMAQIA
jgi:hypothetical protein